MNRLRRIKLGLAFAGLALAGLAVALDDRRIIWMAIAFLAAALAVRLVGRREESSS
jgi:hypothetical protein